MSNNKQSTENVPSILKKLDGLNHNKNIKLRFKKTATKGYSLYLDLWYDDKRHYEFLKLYVTGKREDQNKDKEKIRVACAMRDQKEIDLFKRRTGFELTSTKEKADFIDYLSRLTEKKNHHNWNSCLKHLINFAGNNLPFKNIDKKFCSDFKEYLLSKVDNNTAQSYFAKFKAALNIAINEDIITTNPAKNVVIKKRDTTREFLTIKEIKMLKSTPSYDIEVKNAFLFSCFTGLRISDIRELTFEKFLDGYLHFRQQKTDRVERIKLHPEAVDILNEQKKIRSKSESDKVFLLPLDSGTLNKVVRNWVKEADISKRITFHCARHTFATLCLNSDIDIYTVSKLLGHRDLKTTQIYAKLIDKKKDEAIDKLPLL